MTRGDFYLVKNPPGSDPKRRRIYLVVARQALIDSSNSTVVCAPVHTSYHGLASEVIIGVNEGIKHSSSVLWDNLVSVPKDNLTNYIGRLDNTKMAELDAALKFALDLR